MRSELHRAVFVLVGLSIPLSPQAARGFQDGEPVSAPRPLEAERLIYLPYKDLKTVLDKHSGTVFMPYADYLKLVRLARGEGALRAGKDAVPAVITESHYTGTVERGLARIQARLTVQVLRNPWAEIPLQFGEAAVGRITSDGERVLLRGTGEGTYSLLLPDEGTHNVTIELMARVHRSADGSRIELKVPPVGITTFDLTVPEPEQTVEVSPRLVTLPVEAAGDGKQTRVKAALGSTKSIAARWHPRAGVEPQMDLLAGVTNHLQVTVQDDLVHTRAQMTWQVLRGELTELRIAVPAGDRILDVAAPGAQIKGWKTEKQSKRQLVTVELLAPVTGRGSGVFFRGGGERRLPVDSQSATKKDSRPRSSLHRETGADPHWGRFTIEVHTERPLPRSLAAAGIAEDGTVHGIHAVDAVRESGTATLTADESHTLSIDRQSGWLQAEAAEVPAAFRRAGALHFKFYDPRGPLKADIAAVRPRVTARQTAALIFGEDELRLESSLAYKIERAGVFELRLRLPAGLSVDDVTGPAVKDHTVEASDGERLLRILLDGRRQGEVLLQVKARRKLPVPTKPGASGEAGLVLPLPEPRDVERETGRVFVYAPPFLEVITDEQKLTGAHAEPISSAPRRAELRSAAAWSYSRRPVEIAVRTRRRPTRLTARLGTEVHVRPQIAEVATTLEYHVEHAGIDTFRFQAPEGVADELQIRLADPSTGSIKQRSRAPQAEDGWVTWTVVMQKKALGRLPLLVTYDLKPSGQAAGGNGGPDADQKPGFSGKNDSRNSLIVVQPLRPLGVDARPGRRLAVELSEVLGEVAVRPDRSLSITAEAKGGDVERIDVRELSVLPAGDAVAFRYHDASQPVQVAITAARLDVQPVVETVVTRGLVEVLVTRDETLQYRCRYRVKSSRRQRLRVDLPQAAEPLAVVVAGRDVQLERPGRAAAEDGWEAYYLDVSRPQSSDEEFPVVLQFRAPLGEEPFEWNLGRLHLRLPQFGGSVPDAADHSPDGALAGAELGPGGSVAVQELRTVVWVPREFALVDAGEGFHLRTVTEVGGPLLGELTARTSTKDLDRWIDVAAAGIFDFPDEGHAWRFDSLGGAAVLETTWWNMSFATWIISGALLLIAVVLARTSWENKLSVVLLIALAAVLYALRDAETVYHGLIAARYGLIAGAVWWLIHGLVGLRRRAGERRAAAPPPRAGVSAPQGVAAVVIPPPGVFRQAVPEASSGES